MVRRIQANELHPRSSEVAPTGPDRGVGRAGAIAQSVQRKIGDAIVGSLSLRGERMSKVDTAWLRMDGEANLMMITGVWLLQPGVDYEALCQRVQERLLKFPRFGQRVVEDAAGATWVDDAQFDIAHHVVHEKLKPHGRG